MANTFNLSKPIDVREAVANIDYLYGPYDSIAEACLAIPIARRKRGLTVGILTNNDCIEYQWKSGVLDADLVQKVEQQTLSLHLIGDSSFTKEEGESIYGQFMVEGGASVKKGVLYQVINGNEVYVQEYGNIGKKSAYTFTIPNPSTSGTYTYRIKVLDGLDNYAITSENANYIEYTLYYGGLTAVYNLTNINAIKVKNYSSVAGVSFQLNIAVRDDTFRISSVCLTDKTDPHSEEHSELLTPSSGSYLGNNTYYLPDESTLEEFNGKQCSIVISYMEGENSRENIKEIFMLMDISTLNIVPEYEGGDYYATLPGYYTFQLESGVENISVRLTPGENTDFNFEPSTVLTYRRFSLKVIPDNIVKDNAQIVINYYYTYNNVEYTGSFTRTIGNIIALPEQEYYDPGSSSTMARETLVYSDINDYTGIEDGQYYKVISSPKSNSNSSQLTSSFILDTYCKINQTNDKSINYIKITYGGVDVATVTEDEISCATRWRSLYTDTPLNEWTQIGIGVNLQETFERGGEEKTGYYHCIYINGMVVKSVLIDGTSASPLAYDSSNRLVVTIGNNILVQKCFLYYRTDGENIITPNTDLNVSIIYNNYKSHKFGFEEPQNLPKLEFLRIPNQQEREHYFNLINEYKEAHGEDKIVHLAKFGTIGETKYTDMAGYDQYYSSPTIETGATLFSQSVDIKKPAQKEYAVLCRARWMGEDFGEIIVEVHTQGTSTLVYSVPNFKFTFWRVVGNAVERFYPEFIENEHTGGYYHESVYTAKADFMDSAHLNNTPTCNYYNALIQNLISDGVITGSPSARNGLLDAILGFPIVMKISDNADDWGGIFTNIGSFMLNIDKTGESLGFEIDEDESHLSCISFEGTSNDNEHGAAGRFDIPEGVELKDYTNPASSSGLDENEIDADYNSAKELKKKNLNDTITYKGQTILVRNHPYIKWCMFLSDGLEYRYPDSDIFKEKNNTPNKVMDASHFKKLYKMWYWVYKSDTLSLSDYKEQFVEHFDLDYCMIYFINLMTYAQTDNLGKNAMFDCWDGEHWYPRPYDLDSECGLDNNGNDNIAPFVEIRPTFSLNYDPDKANDYAWLAENYLLDEPVTDPDTGITYPASTIQYGVQTYDRYHFSSNKSKLWITFYKNFKSEINSFYANLRNNRGYTPDTIIELCQSYLIDKLGVAQYNQDFQNKYLGNNDQRLAYGNRWYKFKKWLNKRFAFCDSYFGASESAMYNLVSRINYNIKVDAPQYVAQQYQGEANRETRFVLDEVSFNAGSGAATIITLLVNQPSVFETSLFKYVTLNQGARNYKNLLSLDVSGNKNSLFTNITSVTGEDLSNLKYLNISDSAVQELTLPPNVKTLVAENVNLTTLRIPDNCAVEEISLKGSTFLGTVDFSSLPNLKRLDLTNCVFNQAVTFANLPELDELIMTGAIFNDVVTISDGVKVTSFDFSNLNIKSISFNGSNLNIDTVNFHNTKFGVNTLNLNAIRQNIKNLYFDGCTGLTYLQVTDGGVFENIYCLSLSGSSVTSLGAVNGVFDCSHFTRMGSKHSDPADADNYLRRVSTWNSNGTVTFTGFTFYNTKIVEIINLSWIGSGASLFRDCQQLVSVTGTINITSSIYYMCFRCYKLATLSTVSIINTGTDDVTNAEWSFAGANALSYGTIEDIIRQCTKVTTFASALRCKKFPDNSTVSLTRMFENNEAVTTLTHFLSQHPSSGSTALTSVTNKITVNGVVPQTVTTTASMFYGMNQLTISYNIISNSKKLTTATAMFAGAGTVTFTGNNRPVQTDSHGVAVTLTNAVNKDFFYNSSNDIEDTGLTSAAQMFYNSNIITNDPTLFANIKRLSSTNSTFGSSSQKQFSFKNSQNQTEGLNLNVINMWQNNKSLTDISGCFTNRYNVYCTGLNFHPNITASKTINISGLFGLSGTDYRKTAPITIDLDGIIPKLTSNYKFAVPNNNSNQGPGTFQNRSVNIISTPTEDGAIFGKLSGQCGRIFNGTILYLPASTLKFDLSNVTECVNMFTGCRLYTTSNESEHTYGIEDRTFVEINMPQNCSLYSSMFMNSSVLKNLPEIESASASDLSYMYSGCVINTPDLELRADYFAKCAGSLSNIEYMFSENLYLTTLQYNANRGLFEGCTNLNKVSHMFSGATFLHKGIPVNFFGTTALPRLTSLTYMFANTSIIYDLENNSHKWVDSSTFAPLINLDDISYMFYQNKINSSLNQFSATHGHMYQTVTDESSVLHAVIDPQTFTTKPITNITRVFEYNGINPPVELGRFRFSGFTIGTDAFLCSAISSIDSRFVDNANISSITNVNRMFYQVPNYGPRYNKDIENLSTFVNALVAYPNISKSNIAGHINDSNIPSVYTEGTVEGDAIAYIGFGLQSPSDAACETNWTNYGRHIYS